MARKGVEPTVIWENKPEPSALWRVLCELLNKQDGLFEYVPISKEGGRRDERKEEAVPAAQKRL